MSRFEAWGWLLLTLACVACSARQSDGDKLGGETHWLSTCVEPSDCGSELSCVCGRCTEVCDEDTSCQRWDEGASCLAAGDVAFAAGCAAPPERLCALPATDASTAPGPDATTPRDTTPDASAPESMDRDAAGPEATGPEATTPEDPPPDAAAVDSGVGTPELDCDAAGRQYFCIGEACCVGIDFTCEAEASGGFEDECGCGCNVPAQGDGASRVLYAQRFDDSGDCGAGVERAGSVPYSASCAIEERSAVNELGECFRFDSSCLPNGFSDLDEQTVCQPCETLSEPVFGAPYDDARGCFGELAEAGVGEHDTCDTAETLALAPDGSCWWFPDTCLPDGFAPLESNSDAACSAAELCSEQTIPCSERDLDSCEQDTSCVIASGAPYDVTEACFVPEYVPVACTTDGPACPPVVTSALDPDGNCYSFGGCAPDGFTEATDTDACSQFVQCSP